MPFVPSASSVIHLRRQCPKCHREQVVPASKKAAKVRCKFCRAEIPPAAKQDGSERWPK